MTSFVYNLILIWVNTPVKIWEFTIEQTGIPLTQRCFGQNFILCLHYKQDHLLWNTILTIQPAMKNKTKKQIFRIENDLLKNIFFLCGRNFRKKIKILKIFLNSVCWNCVYYIFFFLKCYFSYLLRMFDTTQDSIYVEYDFKRSFWKNPVMNYKKLHIIHFIFKLNFE